MRLLPWKPNGMWLGGLSLSGFTTSGASKSWEVGHLRNALSREFVRILGSERAREHAAFLCLSHKVA